MIIDNKEGLAGVIVNYADGKVAARAIELGATAREVHVQVHGNARQPAACRTRLRRQEQAGVAICCYGVGAKAVKP